MLFFGHINAQLQYLILKNKLPFLKLAPENRPLEKEIPVGNRHF